MKKFSNQKEISKIAKTTLAMVLAGSFIFSASNAFADGPAPSDQTQTVQTDTTATVQPTEKQQVPSLLPGDFFYFAKMALEKIQLALTFDNTKEAKLLAENAAERLAEAEALFSDGKQQEAVNTIKEALKAMAESDKLVKDQQGNNDETTADDQKTADGSTTTQADGKTTTDDQKTTGEEATTNGQGTTTTNDNQPSDSSQATENDGVKEVKNVLSQNIIALKTALEHVKNPVARAALEKNIDKSYAKLAKKLDKWKEHVAKNHEEEAQKSVENNDATKDETKNETAGNNQTQATTAVSNDKAVVSATTPVTNTDVSTEQKSNATITKQALQQSEDKVQTVQKAAHHELKQVQQKQEEVKSYVKQKNEESRSKVVEMPKTKTEHKVQASQGEHEGNHGKRIEQEGNHGNRH